LQGEKISGKVETKFYKVNSSKSYDHITIRSRSAMGERLPPWKIICAHQNTLRREKKSSELDYKAWMTIPSGWGQADKAST